MTAEVAILNSAAVALAADSAGTLPTENGAKIWNTLNKLYGLSRCHPVGIMYYGSSELAGVPWESLVKLYRQHLGDRRLPTIKRYGQDLIGFLNSSATRLFPRDSQQHFMIATLRGAFSKLREAALTTFQRQMQGAQQPPAPGIAIRTVLDQALRELGRAPFAVGRSETYAERLRRQHRRIIDEAIDAAFNLPLDEVGRQDAIKLAGWFLTRLWEDGPLTGVVIAGFGERELFPSLRGYLVGGVENSRLVYVENRAVQTSISNHKNRATIIPFAQREMVHAFMDGVERQHVQRLHSVIWDILTEKYPALVRAALREVGGQADDAMLAARMRGVGEEVFRNFTQGFSRWVADRVSQPIIRAVAHLPKDELAAMAESLVHLTSLRRHVSLDANTDTVGGPVDVAVISKGDGFVWIRRKHYFSAELNPHFMARYSRFGMEDSDADQVKPKAASTGRTHARRARRAR